MQQGLSLALRGVLLTITRETRALLPSVHKGDLRNNIRREGTRRDALREEVPERGFDDAHVPRGREPVRSQRFDVKDAPQRDVQMSRVSHVAQAWEVVDGVRALCG